MLGVYLSIKTNSFTGRNFSHFTFFDWSVPLKTVKAQGLKRPPDPALPTSRLHFQGRFWLAPLLRSSPLRLWIGVGYSLISTFFYVIIFYNCIWKKLCSISFHHLKLKFFSQCWIPSLNPSHLLSISIQTMQLLGCFSIVALVMPISLPMCFSISVLFPIPLLFCHPYLGFSVSTPATEN